MSAGSPCRSNPVLVDGWTEDDRFLGAKAPRKIILVVVSEIKLCGIALPALSLKSAHGLLGFTSCILYLFLGIHCLLDCVGSVSITMSFHVT